jgi:hypothetical protein
MPEKHPPTGAAGAGVAEVRGDRLAGSAGKGEGGSVTMFHARASRLPEVSQDLAAEAVLAHAGSLDAPHIAGPADAGGIDEEAPRLGVLEEGRGEMGFQRVRTVDDRLGVIGDQDAEDP